MGPKRRRLVLPLILALTLAVAGIGIANAMWFQSLTITGTVKTGSVEASWSKIGCFDVESKDVGTITGAIVDPTHLEYTLRNGYPGYEADCEIEYTIGGTIPVHVEEITLTAGPGLTGCTYAQDVSSGWTRMTCDQLYCEIVDGLCMQLHPPTKKAGSLTCKVLQPAAMDTAYTFDSTFKMVQYNESRCP